MFLGLKIRLYPNEKQKKQIDSNLIACKYIYNYFLKYANANEIYDIEIWKKELFRMAKCGKYDLLNGTDFYALIKELYILDRAFKMYFQNKANMPRVKNSFNNNVSVNISNKNNSIIILDKKIGVSNYGLIKCRYSKDVSKCRIYSVSIKKRMDDYYEASIMYESFVEYYKKTYRKVGIDIGVRKLITTSNNEKFFNTELLDKLENKIIENQKKLSRLVKYSSNWFKQKKVIEKLNMHKANYIKDNLNKITTYLVKKYDIIYMEDLSVKDLLQTQVKRRIRKKLLESSFNTIGVMLEYKAKMYGKKLIKIDRFYPSSQVCSECGFKHNPEDKEVFICPVCGLEIDRDYNAAKNILNYGLKNS